MQLTKKIVPCLWFDSQAEEAAKFYISIFKDGKILHTSHYTDSGHEIHGRPAGSVMTCEFEIAGMQFTALNGGPHFKFTEAISLQVMCDDQAEIDHFWSKLGEGGREVQCGWLTDKFGLSWQIVPKIMHKLFSDSQPEKAGRAMQAMLQMKKFDIAALQKAYDG